MHGYTSPSLPLPLLIALPLPLSPPFLTLRPPPRRSLLPPARPVAFPQDWLWSVGCGPLSHTSGLPAAAGFPAANADAAHRAAVVGILREALEAANEVRSRLL